MYFEKSFKDGKYVSSKDEYCFKEVLDDFPNANQIGIITYNISSSANNYLINMLKKSSNDTEVSIITNIPNRFNKYFRCAIKAREKAKSTIDIYLNKLDPAQFNESMKSYFNFSNHAKIIATNNVAYIGSANFSDESKNNWESGVIIKDKDFIQYLFQTYFKEMSEHSISYYDDDYIELRLSVLRLISIVPNHIEKFMESFTVYYDDYTKYYFDFNNSIYSEDDYSELVFIVDEFNSIRILIENIDVEKYDIEMEIDELLELFDDIKIGSIEELVDYNNSFYDFLCNDFQSIYDIKFEEYATEAYDEYLEKYQERAMDEAQDALQDLADLCQESIMKAIIDFNKLQSGLIDMIDKINELSDKTIDESIDNTDK